MSKLVALGPEGPYIDPALVGAVDETDAKGWNGRATHRVTRVHLHGGETIVLEAFPTLGAPKVLALLGLESEPYPYKTRDDDGPTDQ